MTDPWLAQSSENQCEKNEADSTEDSGQFEDNFLQLDSQHPEVTNGVGSNCTVHQPLPDSDTYLKGLERKLQKLKKGSKLLDALTEKREDCMRTLLQQGEANANISTDAVENTNFELDTPIGNSDSAVQEIYRHLQPVQAVTVGETVHIVKYDQLEQQRQESGEGSEEE